MVLDIAFVAFVLALILLGWFRGLLSQVVTIGALLLLWWFFAIWYPPVDGVLASLGPAFEQHAFLRRLVGFAGAYLVIVLLVGVIEVVLVKRVGALSFSNHWAGGALGGLKGLLYGLAILWGIEAVVLWGRPVDEPPPPFLAESRVLGLAGDWNPVRVLTLREALIEGLEKVQATIEEKRPGDDDDSSLSAKAKELLSSVLPDQRQMTRLRPPPKPRSPRELIQEKARRRDLLELQELWSEQSYIALLRDERVRELLADPEARALLLGAVLPQEPGAQSP